jgi:hypothetical protein
MRRNWSYLPLIALAVASFCLAIRWSILHGLLFAKVSGLSFGFQWAKLHYTFFWFDSPHQFSRQDFDSIINYTVLGATSLAIVFSVRHFVFRRRDA